MARKKAPTNLGQGIPRVGGELVDRLNKLDEGLGTALAYELNHRFSLADVRTRAAAGHAGTVVIAEQARDSVGNKPAAIDVSGGNIAGSSWATQGDELVPLSQVRSLFTCDRFGGHVSGFPGWFEECVREDQRAAAVEPPGPSTGVIPWFYSVNVDIPGFDEVHLADIGESNTLWLWSMVLPSPAIVNKLSFYMESFRHPAVGFLDFGLYDVNGAKVLDMGGFDTTGQPDGFKTVTLPDTVTLDAGTYYFGASSATCVLLMSLFGSFDAFHLGNVTKTRFGRILNFVPDHSTLPDQLTTIDPTVGQDPPLVFFSEE